MDYVAALILAVIQGLTEFIPISSSGHLAAAQHFLRFSEPPIAFDLVLHIGTLAAVMAYYNADLKSMVKDAFRPHLWLNPNAGNDSNGRLMALLVIASVPTAIIGLGLKSHVESAFSDLQSVAAGFLIGGTIMFLTLAGKRRDRTASDIRVWDALVIGVIQGVAIFPGISRSGSTISAGLLLGLKPELAARFSFLLSIPAVVGACLLEARKIQGEMQTLSEFGFYALSGAVAGIIGYLSIKPLIRILRDAKFHYFAFYCWAAGIGLLACLR